MESNTIPRSFWDLQWKTLVLLKIKDGCRVFFYVYGKKLFFLPVYLGQIETPLPLESLIANPLWIIVSVMVIEKRDVSSANKFALKNKPSNKSFIYIRNNNGLEEPSSCHFFTWMVDHWEQLFAFYCTRNWIICLIGYQICHTETIETTDLLCHTLSKALEITIKTFQTSYPSW